ncbi:MAG: DUF402 domain-containing protein, partial [Candidatus Ranarchaeia archaeon]
ENTEVIVEIKEPDYGGRKARATSSITVASPYAVLLRGDDVKISRRIKDENQRRHLIKIGKDLKPKGFTLLWRTASANAPDDFLATDIHQLTQKANRIFKRAREVDAPARLWEGQKAIDFEFPSYVKNKLDRLRRQVTPTVLDHHRLKSSGNTFRLAVDLAEKIMRSDDNKQMSTLLHQLAQSYYPTVGNMIDIEHVKLNGHVVRLGPARIIGAENANTRLTIRRQIRGRGIYDGFNARRVHGDYVLTQVHIDDWFTTSHYFSQSHQLKGIYININTPVERYPWGIHYVDLGVDVVQRPNGEVEIIDLDELDEAIEEKYITEWLKDKALSIAEEHHRHLVESPLPEQGSYLSPQASE